MRMQVVLIVVTLVVLVTCDHEGCKVNCHRRRSLKCGSNGITYLNRCNVQNARCDDHTIKIVGRGPCHQSVITNERYNVRLCLNADSDSGSDSEEPMFVQCASTSIKQSNCASNLCQNGAACIDQLNDYTCVCPVGYEGKNCEISKIKQSNCASNLCQNGATCIDQLNDYTCVCPVGYEGKNCENIKQSNCASNLCQNGAACIDLQNDYTCVCPVGYEGKNCENSTGTGTANGGNGGANGGQNGGANGSVGGGGNGGTDTGGNGDGGNGGGNGMPTAQAGTSQRGGTTATPLKPSTSEVCVESCGLVIAPVCGSDGITYTNECLLESTRCLYQPDLQKASDGECQRGVRGDV